MFVCRFRPARQWRHPTITVSYSETHCMHQNSESIHHAFGGFPNTRNSCCLLLAILALTAPPACADVIYGETSDTDVREDPSVLSSTTSALLPGTSGSPALDRASILAFKLPNLGSVSAPFTSAVFRINLASVTGTPPNLDLYGLGRRGSSTVLAGDYYGKSTTVDPSDATKLQDNILVPNSASGPISTNSNGGTALRDYLNAQYAGGTGANQYVFLRLSTDSVTTSVERYNVTAADSGSAGPPDTRPQIIYNEAPVLVPRPFIWVRDAEKAAILSKIANNGWATNIYNGIVSRVATDLASHQADRDVFLRQLPVNWTSSPAKFKTIPANSESSVRYPTEAKFNDGVDCAVLFYLTGDTNYARCAADILHNAVKTLLPVSASNSTGNGGWIFQDDFLKEARVSGTQLPIIYDFLYTWLQTNQVYDVQTGGMVNFDFSTAQSVFRKLYQLARDHGQKDSNWSALMATTMLNNLLALDNAGERSASLQVYLTTGSSRQASLSYDYRNYTEQGDIWPESLQYAGAVGTIRTNHMILLERYDPTLNLFGTYPNLPLSLPRISQMKYPNGEQISFGDGHRVAGGQPFNQYELVYQHALARGRTDLTVLFGSLINGGVAQGDYNRSSIRNYTTLGQQNEPLQLLWQAAVIPEPAVSPDLPRTDRLPFAGVALQRNPAPSNNPTYGLMCFVGGAGHIHSHASGMGMEIFGMGEVMGAKSGRADYSTAPHEKHYRLFAANNTVIVNGASRGQGNWEDIGINKVQTVAMEPQPFASAVSPDFSFTCSSFSDTKGTLAAGTQQRTMAIIRTSPTSGFYVDVFRSKSTVTNRTATTLDGPVTDQYHDYVYRNIGETTVDLRADGVALPLTSQTNRFQNDIGDAYDQPGWRYFTNTVVSHPTSASVRAQFVATVSGTPRYMDMHMPAVASREYAKVNSPSIVDAPSPYDSKVAPTLVIRQIGEAWNKAFATVYEPHFGSADGTVQNVTKLLRSGVVVGVKVESVVGGQTVVHYVLSNLSAGETYTDASIDLSFTGRFGVIADQGDGLVTLYLGQGSSISYLGKSLPTVSGANSQAEARFVPGQSPSVTSNTPVNANSVTPPNYATWVPFAASSGLDWTSPGNWSPATVPNSVGVIAYKNIDLVGNQTVNVNIPVTLGELVVGDSDGSQTTLLRKNTNGSLLFDQPGSAMAFLTRAAGGTGEVTFNNDLNITLNDDLTVRLGGGSDSSTMTIAGSLSGIGKGLTKEGDVLALVLSGNNTYTGATSVNGGILALAGSGTLGNGADLVLSGGRLDLGTLSATVAAVSITAAPEDGDTIGNGSLSGTSYSASNVSGNAIVAANLLANGSAGFNKSGDGVTTLSGTNTYTSATTVAGGVLKLQSAGALPSGNLALAGGILGLATEDFTTRTLGADINQVRWTGVGGFAAFGAQRAVKFSGSSLNWTASNFIGGGRPLVLGHQTSDATLNWQQVISLAGSTRVIQVDDGSAFIDAKMSGIVTGGSSGTNNVFKKNGTGTLAFTAQNSYWGDTIVGAGTLMIGDGGTAGGVSQNSPNILVESGAILAVNRSNTLTQGTSPLKVPITGDGGFAQVGSGNTVFLLGNTYTGPTTIDDGTLTLGADEVLPDASALTIGDATLDARTFIESIGTLEVKGAAVINLDAGASLSFVDSSAIEWTSGTLTITGTFVSGSSLSFGTTNDGLTPAQLALISAPGLTGFGLDENGYLTANSATGYAAWSIANAPTTGNAPNADEDGDNVANAIEYVLGGGILTQDQAMLPAFSTTGENIVFTFVRDQASIDGVTEVEIQMGDNLADWPATYPVPGTAAEATPGVTVRKNVPAAGKDTVTLTVPQAPDTRKFARIRVNP